MSTHEQQIVIVTGAATGIGRAIAKAFAAAGSWVIAADVAEQAPLGETRVDRQRLDVADEASWQALIDHAERRYGRVTTLVNAAGVITYEPIHDLATADWEKVVAVDQTGVHLGMRAVIPGMLTAGGGCIINISSAWGVVGGVGVAAYNAAKGAVGSMSRNAAVTYAGEGIRVNTVIPGWIRTPLTDRQPADANARVIGATPVGHGGDPEDIAAGCLYLAGPGARFVTGSDLVIDGGFLAS